MLMFRTLAVSSLVCIVFSVFWMRYSSLLVSIMAKEVKVEPYSMAFVTAPNKDVAKTLAGGLGKITKQFCLYLSFNKLLIFQ